MYECERTAYRIAPDTKLRVINNEVGPGKTKYLKVYIESPHFANQNYLKLRVQTQNTRRIYLGLHISTFWKFGESELSTAPQSKGCK